MTSISAIIPAFRRVSELRHTLEQILNCSPAPDEVLVHADGADPAVLKLIQEQFPQIRLSSSQHLLGPGGSRDVLIKAAKCPWVANFDDDSHPIDRDYFLRVAASISSFPQAAILSAITIHSAAAPPGRSTPATRKIPVFSGCGCVYNKSWYKRTFGYVALPVSYGMEEIDLSLQLYALGGEIVESTQLRVHHHDPYAETPSDSILAYSIANIALLAYLRFPPALWLLVPFQLLSRIIWALRRGWKGGIVRGLLIIPGHLRKYCAHRLPLPAATVLSWLKLRHSRPPCP